MLWKKSGKEQNLNGNLCTTSWDQGNMMERGHTAFFAKNKAGTLYFSNISSAVLSKL